MVKVKNIKVGDKVLIKLPHWSRHTVNEAKVLSIKDKVVFLELGENFNMWTRKKDMKIYEVL